MFKLFGRKPLDEAIHKIDEVVEQIIEGEVNLIKKQLQDPDTQIQLVAMCVFVLFLLVLRLYYNDHRLETLKGERVLNMYALNDVMLLKETFLAYLNAALLEPVLAIAGMEEVVGLEFVINLFMLGAIFWWIWLITDAFDFSDVAQVYKYHVDIMEEIQEAQAKQQQQQDNDDDDGNNSNPPKKTYSWLRLKNKNDDTRHERQSLVGCMRKDISLWFLLACIGAAWLPGVVTHRDVMHAYLLVAMWIILHHSCCKATCWIPGYFVTFLFPSTALMPLEYCLPLMDVSDSVEDLEFVEKFREWVISRTGIEIIIES